MSRLNTILTPVQPKAIPTIETREQARALFERIAATMSALRTVIEEETGLLRLGRTRAAQPLQIRKGELSRAYVADLDTIRANMPMLRTHEPDALKTLRDDHAELQAALDNNLMVLATAHAVAESIIRHASETVAQQQRPQLYGANGRAVGPGSQAGAPVALSRTL